MDLKEIERAIHVLSCGDTNYESVMRLASLQIVHDHLSKDEIPPPEQAYSQESSERQHTPRMTGSEFLEALSDVPFEDAMSVLDEHLEALKVVYPKEYESVIRRLRKIK